MRTGARQGMVIVIAAAVLNAALTTATHPRDAPLAVGLNALVAIGAAVAYVAIHGLGRRRPEAIVLLVLLAVDAATFAVGASLSDLALLAAGYFLLLPMVVALVIPWSTAYHVAWLGLHAGVFIVWAGSVARSSPIGANRFELLALIVVATAVSQVGHVASLHARVSSFSQIQRISALNRQARRDRARLDRLNQLLERSAVTDELTGLKNRAALTTDLRLIRSRIERLSERYGLVMLDLDRFKAINDTRGHLAGDRVLRSVAEALMGILRPGDSAYRYGGEEFVVVIRVHASEEAVVAAERARRTVEELAIPNAANTPHGVLTVSAGVTGIGPEDLAVDDDAWIDRIDRALYRAKAAGRNRCQVTP
jgi:diguanylate cyclase (GGDEF)-like protein